MNSSNQQSNRKLKPHNASQAAGQTRVRFSDCEGKSSVVVAFETSHPGGVLAPLVKALSNLRFEVHQIESRLNDGVRSERMLVATRDGQPLGPERQGLLRNAVFAAMETMNRGITSPANAPDGPTPVSLPSLEGHSPTSPQLSAG